jgi:hypothetical protein
MPVAARCGAALRRLHFRAKSLISLIERAVAAWLHKTANACWIKQLADRLAVCPQSCPQLAIKVGNRCSISNLAANVETPLCMSTGINGARA